MLDSKMLDVAIGLILLYLLISLICSAFTEVVSRVLNLRSKFLKLGIQQMLADPSMAAKLLDHPLVKGLEEPSPNSAISNAFRAFSRLIGGGAGQGIPSYLPAGIFRSSLVDELIKLAPDGAAALTATNASTALTLTKLRQGIEQLGAADPPPGATAPQIADTLAQRALRDALRSLMRGAGDDLAKAQQSIEHWFDDTMDRVSGWYKRHVRWVLLPAALVVVCALNADTVSFGETLWQNQAVRDQVVALAGKTVTNPSGETLEGLPSTAGKQKTLSKDLREGLSDLQLIGWQTDDSVDGDPRKVPSNFDEWLFKAAGLAITLFAVQHGANFWFDLLKKAVNVRSSGTVPAKSESVPTGGGAAT